MPISYITADSLDSAQSGSAPIYGARAWVNFNGTGTVAIRASGNVSSITDSGTGQYTVNFTTAMPDTNFCITGVASTNGATNGYVLGPGNTGRATTSAPVFCLVSNTTNLMDAEAMNVAIFR